MFPPSCTLKNPVLRRAREPEIRYWESFFTENPSYELIAHGSLGSRTYATYMCGAGHRPVLCIGGTTITS
jgi:hypothetical protein